MLLNEEQIDDYRKTPSWADCMRRRGLVRQESGNSLGLGWRGREER